MKKALFLLIISLLFTASCSKFSGKGRLIAEIGSEKVYMDDVYDKLEELPSNYEKYLQSETGRNQFMDILVKERLLLELARKRGIAKRPEIKSEIAEYRKNYKKQMDEYRENLYVSTFLAELQENEFSITEGDVKQYYEDNKDKFASPVEITLSHILLSSSDDAKKVLNRLEEGEKFGKLAEEVSIDPQSNTNGGELGTFREGDLLPEFESVVSKLKTGQHSGVVYTAFGYHILKKTSQKRLPSQSFEDSKADIERTLLKNTFDKWLEDEKKKTKVTINHDVLDSIGTSRE